LKNIRESIAQSVVMEIIGLFNEKKHIQKAINSLKFVRSEYSKDIIISLEESMEKLNSEIKEKLF
jgi:hypothetical protein